MIQSDGYPYKKRTLAERDTQREDDMKRSKKVAICKPKKGVLAGLRRNQHCRQLEFRLPASRTVRQLTSVAEATPWYFVTEALAN